MTKMEKNRGRARVSIENRFGWNWNYGKVNSLEIGSESVFEMKRRENLGFLLKIDGKGRLGLV